VSPINEATVISIMTISFRDLRCGGPPRRFRNPSAGHPHRKSVQGEIIMMAKRILVPLDGSESAETAAALAADLARGSGGEIRLLQVHPVPEHRVTHDGRVVAYADQEMERIGAEGRDYLEGVESRLAPVPIESVVRFGKPAREILVEAQAFGADLIVMTAAPPGWLTPIAGGGLGTTLLRTSPVPVVLVRAA
jgi:nucleotide-binding universal stress UspA family protein